MPRIVHISSLLEAWGSVVDASVLDVEDCVVSLGSDGGLVGGVIGLRAHSAESIAEFSTYRYSIANRLFLFELARNSICGEINKD